MTVQVRPVSKVVSGGQGTVWIAEVVGSGQKVAMKYLKPNPDSPTPEQDLKRFLREVRCQAELNHPNIVTVIGQNQKSDPPWYLMPWADESLRDRIEQNPSGMSEDEALTLFSDLLDAVIFAHSEGVLHRDLKPENVLFIDGMLQVSDFGLSRQQGSNSTTLTMTNVAMGTLAYGAPEQFTDAHGADERADVYALGKILFELLCGRLPWPLLDVKLIPQQFRYIIAKATHPEREQRYSAVEDLQRELKLLGEGAASLQPAADRARMLMESVTTGDVAAIHELHRLFVENSEDLNLFTEVVPYMPQEVLDVYAATNEKGLKELALIFDQYAEGGHAWSYTDVIASFFEKVFRLIDDFELRSRVLARVLIVGEEHNRFYVSDVFFRLVELACKTKEGTLMVARVLRENPESVPFVERGLRESSQPKELLNALDDAAAAGADGAVGPPF